MTLLSSPALFRIAREGPARARRMMATPSSWSKFCVGMGTASGETGEEAEALPGEVVASMHGTGLLRAGFVQLAGAELAERLVQAVASRASLRPDSSHHGLGHQG